jgi:hypothetical protein
VELVLNREEAQQRGVGPQAAVQDAILLGGPPAGGLVAHALEGLLHGEPLPALQHSGRLMV